MSLYSYGFVLPADKPLLASVDVLGFDPRDFFANTPDDDSEYDGGCGSGWAALVRVGGHGGAAGQRGPAAAVHPLALLALLAHPPRFPSHHSKQRAVSWRAMRSTTD